MTKGVLIACLVLAAGLVVLMVAALHGRIDHREAVEVRTLTLTELQDGAFDHEIAFSVTQRRVLRTWLGGERVVEDVGHGIAPSSGYALTSSEESVIRVEGGRLRPVGVGAAALLAHHEGAGRIDTFDVRVTGEAGRLIVMTEPVHRSQ